MRHPFPNDSVEYQLRETLLTDNFGGWKGLSPALLDGIVERMATEVTAMRADIRIHELDEKVKELEDHVEKLAQDLNDSEERRLDLSGAVLLRP